MTYPNPSPELLPCPNPWCHSHERDFPLHRLGIIEWPIVHGRIGFRVRCSDCGICGPIVETKVAVYAAWNTRALSQTLPAAGEVEHPDERAVDLFAANMKTKLAKAREKGRGGWDDPSQCTVPYLQQLLHEHIVKGDPVDVANFCMMLNHYGASTAIAKQCNICDGTGRTDYAGFAIDDCSRCCPATSRSAPRANCFGIPDEHNGWTITQGPDDRFYATAEHSGDTWDELAEILASPTLATVAAANDEAFARGVEAAARVAERWMSPSAKLTAPNLPAAIRLLSQGGGKA